MSKSPTFGVKFSNVPILNLRWEFRDFYERAATPGFLRHPDGVGQALQTRYFVWEGMPEAGATMMVGRAILGQESYLCYAARFEAHDRGTLTPQLQAACANPFSLGRNAADNYFNAMPALVDPAIPMKVAEPQLWVRAA